MGVVKNKFDDETCVLRFYKIVLSWDYLRLKKQNYGKKMRDGSAEGLKEVKNTYADVDEYINTFEPLLFEEVKAQILKGKDEEEETVSELVLVSECSEVNGFHLPTIMCGSNTSIAQNDLLFLSKKKQKQKQKEKKFGEAEAEAELSSYAFALVEYRQNEQARLRLYLKGEVKAFNTDDVQICSRLVNMRADVSTPKTNLHALKICSLSTIVREYVGMWSISSLPFKDVILTGADKDKNTEDRAWKLSVSQTDFIESNYNKSQLEAIYAGLSRKPFVLIQGPPGTGKTQTILGLLSAVLHASPARVLSNKGKLVKHGSELPSHERYNHWDKASPWLNGINPRDLIMPINGDDGFFPISGNELKPEVVNSIRKYRVRVLVCAPSNSALDEIVLRLLNTGIRDENGYVYNPKIVRIGLNPHHSVQGVSMDYLVEQKRSGVDFQAGDKRQGGVGNDRDSIRASILDEAVIVFSTLSFSGSSLFSKLNRSFDVVIIDEAAQAVETATLVPLANGCRQVFLVGDPVQLPATVISSVAEEHGYGMSLFKRFQMAGYPVQMLKTQYRMNPEIRKFPSQEFYDNALEDGPDVEVQTRRTWHKYRCLGPFCFFDIHEGKESKPQGSQSWVNHDEVDFVLAMYSALVSRYPELKTSSRLAIISPYKHQVKLFKEKFRSTFGIESKLVVDINTVDGFQGREKDVAIFSCVRAREEKGIGFVNDFRRMNVGITRARSSVLVVGSASTLRREDQHWKNLIESAEKTEGFFKVTKPYSGFFSEANLETMVVKESKQEEDPGEEVGYDMGVVTNAEDNMDWGDAGEDDGDLGGGEDD